MTVHIKVYSDYVCPFCFVGKAAFEEAIKGKDVEVEWMPFELRPSPYLLSLIRSMILPNSTCGRHQFSQWRRN